MKKHDDNCEMRIKICSMRPQPGTPDGDAWIEGCRKGYEWGKAAAQQENSVVLSESDWDEFVEIMQNPGKPSESMIKVAKYIDEYSKQLTTKQTPKDNQ